jgi:hypothetical protein
VSQIRPFKYAPQEQLQQPQAHCSCLRAPAGGPSILPGVALSAASVGTGQSCEHLLQSAQRLPQPDASQHQPLMPRPAVHRESFKSQHIRYCIPWCRDKKQKNTRAPYAKGTLLVWGQAATECDISATSWCFSASALDCSSCDATRELTVDPHSALAVLNIEQVVQDQKTELQLQKSNSSENQFGLFVGSGACG